jgi:hypothetical protein
VTLRKRNRIMFMTAMKMDVRAPVERIHCGVSRRGRSLYVRSSERPSQLVDNAKQAMAFYLLAVTEQSPLLRRAASTKA